MEARLGAEILGVKDRCCINCEAAESEDGKHGERSSGAHTSDADR